MADKKISELDLGISRVARTDFVPVLDGSANETKKIQFKNLPQTDLEKIHAYPFTTDFQSNTKQTRNLHQIDRTHGYIANSNLTDIDIGSNVKFIESFSFFISNLTGNVKIPNSVSRIDQGAFYGCNRITGVQLSKSINEIKFLTFASCSNLMTINTDELDNLTSIGSDAFSFCTKLSSITIPDTVTNISDRAFHFCTGLTGINCNVSKGILQGPEEKSLLNTEGASALVINARASDDSWVTGSGQFVGGNDNVTVLKNL